MIGRSIAAIAVYVLALAGCSGDGGDDGGRGTPSPTASAPRAGGPPTVRLLSAGSGERRPLRYAPVAGATGRTTMTMRTAVAMTIAGQPNELELPELRMVLAHRVTEVADDGAFTVEYEIAEATGAGGSGPGVDQVRAAVSAFTGTRGTATITPGGVLRSSRVDIPESLPEVARQLAAQFEQQAQSFATPFPEEPVGAGARWVVTARDTAGGFESEREYTYTLRELTGTRYALDLALRTGAAAGQRANPPGLPEGATVEVRRSSGEGSGETVGDLTAAFPARSTTTAATEMLLAVTEAGRTTEIEQRFTLHLELRRS